jgi:hypothetical protein
MATQYLREEDIFGTKPSSGYLSEEDVFGKPEAVAKPATAPSATPKQAAAPAPATAPAAKAPADTSGLNFALMPEQFKSGVAGMQQAFYTTGAKRAIENLQILDKIDKGEAVPEVQDPLGYQQMSPAQRAAARAELEKYVPKNVARAVAYGAEQRAYAKNPLAEQFVKAANEGGFKAALDVFAKDPIGIVQQFSVQSAPNQLPRLVGGAAAYLLRGGVPGLVAGLSTGTFPVEYMASLVESLQDAKVNIKDAKAVEAKLRDPKFLEDVGKIAVTRGQTTALFEGLTGAVAAPITRGAGLAKNFRAAGRNLAVEPGMEAFGESTAQQAAGQEFKLGEVLAEALGAGPQVATTTALRTAVAQTPEKAPPSARAPVTGRVEPTLDLSKQLAPEGRVEPTMAPSGPALRAAPPVRAELDVDAEVAWLTSNLPVTEAEARSIVAGRQRREQEKVGMLAGVAPPVLRPDTPTTPEEARLLDIYNEFIDGGFPPDQAETLAREQFAKEQEEVDAGETVNAPSGVGVGVAGVPGSVAPTGGTTGTESDGVVPPTADAGQPAGGAGTQPGAVDAGIQAFELQEQERKQRLREAKNTGIFHAARGVDAAGGISVIDEDGIASIRENLVDTLDEQGVTDQQTIDAALAGFDAEIQRLRPQPPAEGTTDVSQTTQAQQTEAQGQEEPAADAGAVTDTGTPDEAPTLTGFAAAVAPRTGEEAPKGKRGRPVIARTEEEKQKIADERKLAKRRAERAQYMLDKSKGELEGALAPIDEDAFETDDAYESALKDQAAARDNALRGILTVEMDPQLRGTAVQKRAKAALKESRADEKDIARIRASVQKGFTALKSTSQTSRTVNPGIEKATTLEQALRAVIKTGTPLQKFFAKRLMAAAKGVRFVVVSPERLDSDPDLAGVVGIFDGDNAVFVRAASGDKPQGVNNVTVLHEALHAAASRRLNLGLAATNVPGALTQAAKEIVNLMIDAERTYNLLTDDGTRFPSENLLAVGTILSDSQGEVFSDPNEFLSYSLTEPAMEQFLLESVPGTTVRSPNGFSRFVASVMKLVGISTDNDEINNAFGALVAATDKLLGAPITPRMKAVEAFTNFAYAARGPKPPVNKVAQANQIRTERERAKDVQEALKKLRQSEESQKYKSVAMLQRMRDESDYLIPFKVLYSKANRATKAVMAQAPTLDFLARFTEKDLPAVKSAYQVVQQMLGHINALHQSALDQLKILDRAFKADKTLEDKINQLAYASTLAEVNPSDPNAVERDNTLDRLYAELGEKGQEIFKRILAFHNSLRDYQQFLLDKQIESLPGLTDEVKENLLNRIYQKFAEERRIEPYIPLIRDAGEFWLAVGKGDNTQFFTFDTAEKRDAEAARIAREDYSGANVQELLYDGEFAADNNLSTLRNRVDIRGTLLSELFDVVDGSVARDNTSPTAVDARALNEKLKNDLFDLWLSMLPEQAFRKQFISRKGRAGFRPDIRRNLASHMARIAPVLSRIKYGNALRAQMDRIQMFARTDPNNFGAIRDEMQARIDKVMSPNKRGLADAVAGAANKLTYLTYLTGAITAFLQPFGIWISGLPILTANHNTNPATVATELAKVSAYFKQYGIARRLPDGSIAYEAPSLANSKTLSEEERRAVRAMVDMNVATNNFTGLLWDANRDEISEAIPARTPAGRAKQIASDAVDLAVNAPLRNVERLTREALYLASYRLGRQRGLTEAEAIWQAASDVKESLGDYDQASRPRWMQNPAGRVLFAMKMYPVVVTQQLIGSFINIIKPMNGQTRKQALIKFSGIYMMAAMLAGMYNAPFADLMISALAAMLKDMDDDDLPDELKDKNPNLWFKTVFMPELLGDRKIFGVPLDRILGEGSLTAFSNLAIGQRIGLNDLWFRDGKPSANTQDAVTNLVMSAFPLSSYAMSVAKAVDDMAVGDYERAFERSVPLATVRNIMTTKRVAEKGYDTTRGTIVKPEDVSKADLFWQSLGVTPADVAAARDLSFKASGITQETLNQRNLIIRRIKFQFNEGDADQMREIIRTEVRKFNKNNPTYPITPKQLLEILEAEREAKAMSRAGTPIDEKNIRIFREAVNNMKDRLEERKK